MRITAFLVSLIPLVYLATIFTKSYAPVFGVSIVCLAEILSGFSWSGFNLSAGNFVYDAVTRQRMALCVAYMSVINAFGAFLGATIGGIIASFNFTFLSLSIILIIFVLSSLLRLIVAFILNSHLKEVRTVQDFDLKNHIKKQISFPGRLSKLIPFASSQQSESLTTSQTQN